MLTRSPIFGKTAVRNVRHRRTGHGARQAVSTLTLLLVGALACRDAPRSAPPRPVVAAAPVVPGPATTSVRGPDAYRVRFETTRGAFVLDVVRANAPRGADRLHELVRIGFFSDVRFYRMVQGFIAQFGIHGTPSVQAQWDTAMLQDDRPRLPNTRGTVAFAASGPNTRATELFISTGDNRAKLDRQRLFAPLGTVVEGMAVVDSLYHEYGEEPNHARIARQGNAYLARWFPGLDYIRSATIVPQ